MVSSWHAKTVTRSLRQGGGVLPVVAGIVRVCGVIVQVLHIAGATACGRPGPPAVDPLLATINRQGWSGRYPWSGDVFGRWVAPQA